MSITENDYRTEEDFLGTLDILSCELHGIHTARALQNFQLLNNKVHPSLICSYGAVKLACAMTNNELGVWKKSPNNAVAIIRSCTEMSNGFLNQYVVVDALQGGAGTSTNMNINEVLANRALKFLNKKYGEYSIISPIDDINLYQSTNDTYPTALKIAAINLIQQLETSLCGLEQSFSRLGERFSHIVKLGRTQFQDAVLTTLGNEMLAYAECLLRDRKRLNMCKKQLHVVNLGGTAIGNGFGAPKRYIALVVGNLCRVTGLNLKQAKNMIENTQNLDIFVAVSSILKVCASNLIKISTDLRLLSSGPEAGFSEIILPQRQVGSSIMPGKINPVMPEAVTQVAILVKSYDQAITTACGLGVLELNSFLPLIAHCLLSGIEMLTKVCNGFREYCVDGIKPNETKCLQYTSNSTAEATNLIVKLGYTKASHIFKVARQKNKTIKETIADYESDLQ